MLHRSIVFILAIALAVCASALAGAGAAESGATAELPDVKVGDKYTETVLKEEEPMTGKLSSRPSMNRASSLRETASCSKTIGKEIRSRTNPS